jgi:septin 4
LQATLWLCEDYPLSLQEQIMPIVDLMAISSSHFARLKDFIQMQLPAGFPVKIGKVIFLFFHHMLNRFDG